MTKPIVSVALLILLEEGYFRLVTPASEFLPKFADLEVYSGMEEKTGKMQTEARKHPVTIHQLLTHTSGLTYEMHAEHHTVSKLYQKFPAKKAPISLEWMVDIC